MRARHGIAATAVAGLCAAGAIVGTSVDAGASPLGTSAHGASAHGASARRASSRGASSRGASQARPSADRLTPGNLVVSGSRFVPDLSLTAGQTILPPGCQANCATATAGGLYPQIFNNDQVDGSFGITSPIFLDEMTPGGLTIRRIQIPPGKMVSSFSSKSELSLNVSPDGDVSFMGYAARPAMLDVSNSNTPGVIDPTNPVSSAFYREVALLSPDGRLQLTDTNAYSGNNGRAAVVADVNGQQVIYTAGNAGNGASPQPAGVILGAGAQIMTPGQTTAAPTPVGSFNVTELGDKPDKVGKDDNFRGLALYHDVLYYTKGSGGNGVNTVYFLDTTGAACPNGVGLPAANAPLPASPLAYSPATLQANGLLSNMCVLKGFPTALKSATSFPFGLWFASPTTLYVADEGSGANTFAAGTYPAASASATAGLQKWVFDSEAGEWKLAYALQGGLNLGQPYTPCPATRMASTRRPGCPGLPPPTGSVTSPGASTPTAP